MNGEYFQTMMLIYGVKYLWGEYLKPHLVTKYWLLDISINAHIDIKLEDNNRDFVLGLRKTLFCIV